MGERIPRSYANLIEKIREEKKQQPVINKERMSELGKGVNLSLGETETAFQFLNDIGTLYYSHQMEDLIVLEPTWLIDALTRIVTAQPSQVANGIFTTPSIHLIWHEYLKREKEQLSTIISKVNN